MSKARTVDSKEVGDDDRNVVVSLVIAALIAVRTSFLGFVVAVGVVVLTLSFLLSGYVVPSVNYGIISGMMFIWGVSALLYAALGKALLRLIGYG
jgi:predicted phage tail protein